MSSTDLLSTFQRLARPRVLVLGDLILDRYIWGDAERVSQEAPVIVLRAQQRESRLGGAGNVCHMVRGLEGEVTCLGVIGDDSYGRDLRRLLADVGVDTGGIICDLQRPTTVKERFMGRTHGRHPHQILRVDSEDRQPLSAELEARLIDRMREEVAKHDVVLISDYGKGVCTARLVSETIAAAGEKPVLVDPLHGTDYTRYRGAAALTPNRTEAGLATGIRIETVDDALVAGRKLCRELKLQMAIVTLDRDGMALVRNGGQGQVYATRPRAVYDVTGAGDMVLAMLGMALASGLAPEDAVRLANVAGGLEVEKVGVAIIPRWEIHARLLSERQAGSEKIVDLPTLAGLLVSHRAAGQRVVLTNGCFDLLHVGHIQCLQEAARLGDVLVVAVNSDASVRRLKGEPRPVLNQSDRAAIIAALGSVDYVVTFEDDTPDELIRRLRPDILVKGGTYGTEEVVGRQQVRSYGGEVRVTSLIEGISTAGLLANLGKAAPIQAPHFSAATIRETSTS